MNVFRPFSSDKKNSLISIAVSEETDEALAIQALSKELPLDETSFILLFFPEQFAPNAAEGAINTYLGHIPVYGCSTAGQITPDGYKNGSYLAIAFPKSYFRAEALLIKNILPFSLEDVSQKAITHYKKFGVRENYNCIGLLFSDGLSKIEDVLIASLTACLPDMPIFGGSAADGLKFEETLIFAQGRFHFQAALLLMIETQCDIKPVHFDHFMPTQTKLVITDASADERIVHEINGAPACYEYARLVGVAENELSPEIFAQNPLLIHNGDNYYVRAIQQPTGDGGLAFLCAIDSGLIMHLGVGTEIVRTLEKALSTFENDKVVEFILAFDCFLRRLEIEQTNRLERASTILSAHKVIGFNTYGEQYNGVHVNQTFVGLAFFKPNEKAG